LAVRGTGSLPNVSFSQTTDPLTSYLIALGYCKRVNVSIFGSISAFAAM
jgi:hypothetical protein